MDNNWSSTVIDIQHNKTLLDEWREAIALCEEKGYHYAVSNPFFEIWLLLHHDEPKEEDKLFAVTDDHNYEKTNHFRVRLRDLGVPLRKEKHINMDHYNDEKIRLATERAMALHMDRNDRNPRYFATTVYMILEKMMEML